MDSVELPTDFEVRYERLTKAGRPGWRRREFLLRAFALGGLTARSLSASETRRQASDSTRNADFFVRNHFAAPKLNDETWALDVTGLVSKPVRLSYADLLLMPSVRQAVTLECAGNPPGGTLVGTSLWSGVPLAALLKQADVGPGATAVVLHGADSGDGEHIPPGTHFARAIPIEKAMAPATLLAYEMNGDPLPAAHGFPVRALVSGWYGMDSVKWLNRIEVLKEPFAGYFQQEEYVSVRGNGERQPIARMLVSSKMIRPSEGEEIRSGTYRVEGLAWAGERKIAEVQVRVNGLGDWQRANLQTIPVAMAWTPWSFEWHIPSSGQYTLDVRATDEDGNVQPDARDPDRKDPYQLNAPHRVKVNVRL